VDAKTKQNREKVRLALEAAGKTDSFFYRRAIAIAKMGYDPEEPPAPNKI